jgi:hypothetical protein
VSDSLAMRPRERREREEAVGEWRVRLVSYRLGLEFVCTADNVDPAANIARSRGTSREEVEAQAMALARERLSRTRVRPA